MSYLGAAKIAVMGLKAVQGFDSPFTQSNAKHNNCFAARPIYGEFRGIGGTDVNWYIFKTNRIIHTRLALL